MHGAGASEPALAVTALLFGRVSCEACAPQLAAPLTPRQGLVAPSSPSCGLLQGPALSQACQKPSLAYILLAKSICHKEGSFLFAHEGQDYIPVQEYHGIRTEIHYQRSDLDMFPKASLVSADRPPFTKLPTCSAQLPRPLSSRQLGNGVELHWRVGMAVGMAVESPLGDGSTLGPF
jgi:hypothetical protein